MIIFFYPEVVWWWKIGIKKREQFIFLLLQCLCFHLHVCSLAKWWDREDMNAASPCSADVMTMGGLFLNFQCGKWVIIVQLDSLLTSLYLILPSIK